jgi:dienelactone hydrolase
LTVAAAIIMLGTSVLTVWESKRPRTLPAPTGPYAVGRRSFAWHDDSRADTLSPDKSATREIFVWAWYPAASQTDSRPAPYLPASWLQAYRQDKYEQRLDRVHGHAFEEPEISQGQRSYPVLIFSPGGGQLPTHYTALLEDLASHGYVVLAVAHPFDTPLVVFPDGRVARWGPIGWQKEFRETTMILAADLVSVLDHAIREHEKNEPFFSHIDPQRIGVFGHSIGGAAAAEACGMDARFKAGMNFDGTVYGDVVEKGVQQPFFLIMAAQFRPPDLPGFRRPPPQWDPNHDKGTLHEDLFLSHSVIAYRLTVSRLSHMNFSDKGFFFDAEDRLAELVGVQRDALETTRLASRYARAFFGQYLMCTHSPGHELDTAPSTHVRLEVHTLPQN